MIYAYARISTQKEKQKTDRQIEALKQYAKENNFEFDKIKEEKISGTVLSDKRPELSNLKNEVLRKGDILVVTDIDRLGRNADDVIMLLKELKSKGIRVVALDTPHMNEWNKVNDDSIYEMIIDILITLKAHMAQQEREKLVSRINQGLDSARAKGKKLGRPPVELPKDFIKEYEKFKNGEYGNISATQFAKVLEIGRSTLYKYIDVYEIDKFNDLINKCNKNPFEVKELYNNATWEQLGGQRNNIGKRFKELYEKGCFPLIKKAVLKTDNHWEYYK